MSGHQVLQLEVRAKFDVVAPLGGQSKDRILVPVLAHHNFSLCLRRQNIIHPLVLEAREVRMSSFSYPAPFQFGQSGNKPQKERTTPASPRSATESKPSVGASPRRVKRPDGPGRNRGGTPTRTKSADDAFPLDGFGKKCPPTKPVRRLGPKTKSGRHLPKPAAPSRPMPSGARARSPPKRRGVAVSRSSNLESMGSATKARSSSLPRNQQPRSPSPSDSPEEKKPSSLKNFLLSPLRKAPGKTQSGNLEELRKGLQASPGTDSRGRRNQGRRQYEDGNSERSLSPETGKKTSSFKQFLTSPLRKAPGKSKSSDSLKMIAPSLDSDSEEEDFRSSHGRSGSRRGQRSVERSISPEPKKPNSIKQFLTSPMRRATPTRTRSSDSDIGTLPMDSDSEDDNGRSSHSRSLRHQRGGSDKKTKTFKQLLGKKSAPGRTKSGDLKAMTSGGKNRGGRAQSPPRRPLPPEREPSLSPEDTRKPKSMINNLLDNLYDSYVKGEDDEGSEDDMRGMNDSVSRLDMSLTRFF